MNVYYIKMFILNFSFLLFLLNINLEYKSVIFRYKMAMYNIRINQAWPRGRPRSTRGEEHAPSSLPLPVFPFWPLASLIPSIALSHNDHVEQTQLLQTQLDDLGAYTNSSERSRIHSATVESAERDHCGRALYGGDK